MESQMSSMHSRRQTEETSSTLARIGSSDSALSDSSPLHSKMRNSLPIFRRYLTRSGDTIDASRIVSRECFMDWLGMRGISTPTPEVEKSFQRTLTAHVTGSDGRQPFSPEEEHAILAVLRKKCVWHAFQESGASIGSKGFRSLGYHERNNMAEGTVPMLKKASSAKRLKELAAPTSQPVSPREVYDRALLPPAPLPPRQASITPFEEQDFDEIAAILAQPTPVPPVRRLASAELDDLLVNDEDLEQQEANLFFTRVLRSLAPPSNSLFPSAPTGEVDAPTKQSSANKALLEHAAPNKAIIVIDLNAKDFESLIIAQNSQSVALVGLLGTSSGGKFRTMVDQSELVTVFRHVWYCVRNPGVTVTMTIPVQLASGSSTPRRVEVMSVGGGLVLLITAT